MFEEKQEIIISTKGEVIETTITPQHQILVACEENIREDCKGQYMERARNLFTIGYYDHAVLEYWNRGITDLKDKLTIYGLEHFPSEYNIKVTTREDLADVKDSIIINACQALGLIDDEAHIFLIHCLNIRNKFTAAHDTTTPIDPIEAINLIKNCVKYVLQRDVPSPAITINDLIKYIQSESFDVEHFRETVKDQSPKVVESFLRRVFNEYIEPLTSNDYRDNLKLIVRIVWDMIGEGIKSDIGQKLVHLKLDNNVDKSLYAMDFMLQVKGMKYIPTAVRKHIFIKKAQELIDAHHGMNNFYNEVRPSRELEELGYNIPDESLDTYVKAITFSFTGNSFGYSNNASSHNQAMFSNLSTKGVQIFLDSLENNTSYAWHFMSPNPVKRLVELLKILEGKSNLLPKHKIKITEFLKKKALRDYFIKKTSS
ncbi:hypothetical protein [Bacillus amyloliquefaciens]|uniref:hypothetical protein n=1 Tax=Bacillus amyloliquefaciens TaxID=1390 RepID=UPI0007799E9F|nr:hypothetical protein [Bacillus amyloliquefaciens]KYC92459.1 hypothetical protein B425_4113 [Bacillus amyloliquefaciens]MEC1246663.1 hypothetical protein [Bacillus amyloliquefaciens]MEC2254550.1 hypothetical protein [Bacillus amyloliquefaciens]MED0831687.1 hypothetical protein [Bacillus amyloliquefaciens]MED4497543.1 hypothetical protein [Bacillus amyloliquefaciens]